MGRRRGEIATPSLATTIEASPAVMPAPPTGTGFALLDGMLVSTDATRAMATVEAEITPLLRDGDRSAESVLTYLTAKLFPDERWPPQRGTEAAAQWDYMVDKVSALLERGTVPPPRLKVVK